MTEPEIVEFDASHAASLARLCAAAIDDPPAEEDLTECLYSSPLPVVVHGVPDAGVVAFVNRGGEGFIRLLAVHPDHRGRGLGNALLAHAEEQLSACRSVTIGSDAPDYLFPGVDTGSTELAVLAENRGYRRADLRLNMAVDLPARQQPQVGAGQCRVATPDDRAALDEWLAQDWPHWRFEAQWAWGKGRLVVAEEDGLISGFCAWGIHRRHWLGPMAVRRDGSRRGVGTPLLHMALDQMAAAGLTTCEVAWVGPVAFYAKAAAARISRVFIVFERAMK